MNDKQPMVFLRIGGVGVRKVIYECPQCGCAVTDTEQHEKWHASGMLRP